jgi:hypothetical protein
MNRVANGYRREDRYGIADQPTPAMPRAVEAPPAAAAEVPREKVASSDTTPVSGTPAIAPVPSSGLTPIPIADRPAHKAD